MCFILLLSLPRKHRMICQGGSRRTWLNWPECITLSVNIAAFPWVTSGGFSSTVAVDEQWGQQLPWYNASFVLFDWMTSSGRNDILCVYFTTYVYKWGPAQLWTATWLVCNHKVAIVVNCLMPLEHIIVALKRRIALTLEASTIPPTVGTGDLDSCFIK